MRHPYLTKLTLIILTVIIPMILVLTLNPVGWKIIGWIPLITLGAPTLTGIIMEHTHINPHDPDNQ